MRDRAWRRLQFEKAVQRAAFVVYTVWGLGPQDQRYLARMAETGCRPCNCMACTGKLRKGSEAMTRRDRRAEINFEEECNNE